MAKSAQLVSVSERYEQLAQQIGFYAFNRWARRRGLSLEATHAVIRNVF